jgi:O-antigen/teichoic acid export membrane protein
MCGTFGRAKGRERQRCESGKLGRIYPLEAIPRKSGKMTLSEDTGSGRRAVARNAFYLVLRQALTTVLAILFSAALGRVLGVRDFGLYFLVTSFSTFAYVLVDWGQQFYVIREIARQPERGSLLLGTSLVLRAAGTVLVTVPSGVAAWALGYDAVTRWYLVAFIAVSLPFFLAQGYGMVFRGRDQMDLDAGVTVANKVALVVFGLVALALGQQLPGVLAAQALSGLLALAVAAWLYRRVTTGPLSYSPRIAREILAGGGALFTYGAVANVQPYIDLMILSKLATPEAVGWFAAAKNIMGTVFAPALILGTASFPRLARMAANKETFRAEIGVALRPILWLGALAGTGTFLFADDVIALIYGDGKFRPSGVILQLYAPGLTLLFIDVLLVYALAALHRATALSVVKIGSVLVSTLLALLLIPVYQQRTGNGGIGVAAAFVASEFVVFGCGTFILRREIPVMGFAINIARAAGSAALTLLLFWWLPRLPIILGIPICSIAFLLCSIALGLIGRADFELVRSLLRSERVGEKSSTM